MKIDTGYKVYLKAVTGERQGSASAVVLPAVAGAMVWIKAVGSNAGNVYIGPSGVTVVDGTTDVTSGYELAAGDSIGPIPIDNLNKLYIICDNAGDDITYLVVG